MRKLIGSISNFRKARNDSAAIKRMSSKASYCLQSLDKVMVAVNEEFVMNEEMIKAGDIVALIPPVSGDNKLFTR